MDEKGDYQTKAVEGRFFGLRPWGRHSLVLMVAGVVYMAMASIIYEINVLGPRWEALVVARSWMPLKWWALVWFLVGLGTFISARWPPTADRWGYGLLTGFTVGWGTFYAMGVIIEDTPILNMGSALTFWLLGFLWWAVGGLVNPPERTLLDMTEEERDR